ncbi:MAG: glycosyltransferase, partial [Candidatus Pacebacteria bacterium]|nr:glycosyltransferase [Candidatus Paceibacterota bacterium]
SISNQITAEVEVFVRDDSTNSETEELIKQYSKKFPIRYVRGKKEGIDRTVIYLTKEASGEFIWWMGDDVINSNSIAKVLSIIKNHPDVNFIWANYNIFGQNSLAVNILEDRLFSGIDEILGGDVTGLGFISATIFRKKIALSALSGAERYIGSLFSNLYIVLYVLAAKGKSYFLRGPIIEAYPATPLEIKEITTKSGKIENPGFEVYGVIFRNIFMEFFEEFGRKNIRKVLKKSFASLWRGMLVGWVGGWDTPRGKRWKMFKLYWSFPECWVASFIMVMPFWVNKKLYEIYKVFFDNRRFIFKKDLNAFFGKT